MGIPSLWCVDLRWVGMIYCWVLGGFSWVAVTALGEDLGTVGGVRWVRSCLAEPSGENLPAEFLNN